MIEQVQARIRPGDVVLAQRHAESALAYYTRDLKNASGPFRVLRGRLPEERSALARGLEKMGSGRRFWVFVLHHPHWGSEAEQAAIEEVLAEYSAPLLIAKAHNASATLYRTH